MISKLNILSAGVVILACLVQTAIGVPTVLGGVEAPDLPAAVADNALPGEISLNGIGNRLGGRSPPLSPLVEAPITPMNIIRDNKVEERGHPYFQNAGMGATGGGGLGSGGGGWTAGAKHSDGEDVETNERFEEDTETASGRISFTVPLNATSVPSNVSFPSAPSITPSPAPTAAPAPSQTSGAKAKFYAPKFAWPAAFALVCYAHASSFTRSITEKVQGKVEEQKRKAGYCKVSI